MRRSYEEAAMIKLYVLLAVFASQFAIAQVPLPPDEALVKAEVEGKYRMLLKQIAVPEDAAAYGEFKDFGSWFGTTWAGYSDLPQGYWVYVYPRWYIWGQLAAAPIQKRPWGPEQATGEPDSKGPAPETAWSPASRDRPEWILVEFDKPLQITEIILHDASTCPVSYKVSGFSSDGAVGARMDGLRSSGVPSVIRKAFAPPWKLQRLKIDVDSGHQGWKGIDAVGVVDDSGVIHWARSAHASSWRGQEPAVGPEIYIPPVLIPSDEIAALKAEVAALKAEIERLKQQLANKK
jgi:hypothetical protein